MLTDEPRETGGRRYAANVTWLLVAEVAAKIVSFAFVVIVARGVGTHDFGTFSFALSFVPLFLIFGRAGVDTAVVRELVRDGPRLSELFASGLALRLSLALAGLVLALATGPFFLSGARPYAVLVLVAVALLLDELSSFVATAFQAAERMIYRAATMLANRFLSTGLAALAVAVDRGVVAVCAAYVAGSAAGLVVDFILLHRYFPPIDYRQVRRSAAQALLRTGLPLGVAGILNTALFRLDTVLLQGIRGAVDVALYNVAYRFFESFLFVAWVLGTLALPRISRVTNSRQAAAEHAVATSLGLAFYLPLAVMVPFASHWLVTTVFTARYEDAAAAAGLLTAATGVYAVAYSSRIGLVALRQTRAVIVSAATSLAVNLALNLYLIPTYGFTGAAWSTLVAQSLEALLLTGLFWRANGVVPNLRPLIVPVVAAAALAAVLGLSGWRGPNALLISFVVYPVALLLVARVVAPAEVRRARMLLRRDPTA